MKLVIFKKGQKADTEYKVLGPTDEDKVVEVVARYLFAEYIYPELGEIEFPIDTNANNILSKDITTNELILKTGKRKIMCQVILRDDMPVPGYFHWSKSKPSPVFKPAITEVFTWKQNDIRSLYSTIEKLKRVTPPDNDLD